MEIYVEKDYVDICLRLLRLQQILFLDLVKMLFHTLHVELYTVFMKRFKNNAQFVMLFLESHICENRFFINS